MADTSIRVGVIGVGNCASALIQGVTYYRERPDITVGLMHATVGRYLAGDLDFVAAFDVDTSKVGLPLEQAIHAGRNCTATIADVPASGTVVSAGVTLDGAGERYQGMVEIIDPAAGGMGSERGRIGRVLRDAQVDVLVNYLPVGSQQATEFYAWCAIDAGCAFVNAIPVSIARTDDWRSRFATAGLPLVGDDIKSQLGATIVHRALVQLITDRGMRLDRTYQLNVGGNMDFYNMLERSRLESKKESKTSAVTSALSHAMDPEDIHVGPSDYVPWLGDHKLAFIRCEATGFGGVPIELELRMDVWDSPNSAGVVMDAVRCAKVAMDQGRGGTLDEVCAWLMKAPPVPMPDPTAQRPDKQVRQAVNPASGLAPPHASARW